MFRSAIGRVAAALTLGTVLLVGQASAQSSSEEILERLRSTYENTQALRAAFTQQVGGQTLQGTLLLSGDRYRIELPGQTLVSDGTTAWAYSHADNQVLVNRHTNDAAEFSPSAFFTTYPEQFRVTTAGSETIRGARHDVLRLLPRQPNDYMQEVTMYVRASDNLPTRVRILDISGTALTFDLQNIERNPRLERGVFTFEPPTGAEVIDLR